MNKKSKIFVAGHNGMVGSAIIRQLQSNGYENIVTRNRDKLDLVDQNQVRNFLFHEKNNCICKIIYKH